MELWFFYTIYISAWLFGVLFVLTWLFFGKLIRLQIKRWIFASKGYVEIEHISPTKVRNYFIMRPTDKKFEIDSGFYHYISECITRKGDIIKKIDKDMLAKDFQIEESELEGMTEKEKEKYLNDAKAQWKELQGLSKLISGLKYDPELLNRKMGMPVITYYGDNPDPLNPADRDKYYGAGVIRDMYLRLLLTQRYKDFMTFVTIGLILVGIIMIANVGMYYVHNQSAQNANACWTLFNQTQNNYMDLVNKTMLAKMQGNNLII